MPDLENRKGEIAAIIATLRDVLGQLDAMGIRTEGSYISMAIDLLKRRTA